MIKYRAQQPKIATATINSIGRHLHYLTEELIVLSLCDTKLCDVDRSEIAKALVNFKRPLKYEIGKPKFPTLTEKQQHLWQFVGQNSWFLLDKLELNASWLSKPTASWDEYED